MSGTDYVIDQLGDALRNSHAALAEQREQIAVLEARVAELEAAQAAGTPVA